MSRKIITWVKSTGSSMHLGNLMGAILPFVAAVKGKADSNSQEILTNNLQ